MLQSGNDCMNMCMYVPSGLWFLPQPQFLLDGVQIHCDPFLEKSIYWNWKSVSKDPNLAIWLINSSPLNTVEHAIPIHLFIFSNQSWSRSRSYNMYIFLQLLVFFSCCCTIGLRETQFQSSVFPVHIEEFTIKLTLILKSIFHF